MLQFTDGGEVKAIYNYKTDWFMKNNLKNQTAQKEKDMEQELKAIIQSYMERMIEDRLTWDSAARESNPHKTENQ